MYLKYTLFLIVSFFVNNIFAQWEVGELPMARLQHLSICHNEKIYFAGGHDGSFYHSEIDIYDTETGNWSEIELPEPRVFLRGMEASGKLFFAGGLLWEDNGSFDDVNIYDLSSGAWEIEHLSQARTVSNINLIDGKIYFAGGAILLTYSNGSGPTYMYSDVIDIYDVESGEWTVEHLPYPRSSMRSFVHGGKIYYAGGRTTGGQLTKYINIYDVENQTWGLDSLSAARLNMGMVKYENTVLFAGGHDENGSTDVVEIWNLDDGSWEMESMEVARSGMRTALLGGKAYFVNGGNYNANSGMFVDAGNEVEIYNMQTGEWEEMTFTEKERINHAVTSCGGKIYVSGGYDFIEALDEMEIYDPNFVSNIGVNFEQDDISIFPNPANRRLYIVSKKAEISRVSIYDFQGKQVMDNVFFSKYDCQIDLRDLKPGAYFIAVFTAGHVEWQKISISN